MLTYKKITQVINFFAILSGSKINKLKLIKLIYFTDKYHLRKYGRTVINSEYWAMDYGPVAEAAKDIIDGSTFLPSKESEYRKTYIMKEGNFISSLKPVDDDYLSESEIEAVNFVWQAYGRLSPAKLVNETHKYPEWKKFEDRLNSGSTREKMSIRDFFSDSDDELSRATADYVDESYSLYEENETVERVLNGLS
jgi:uncharacterized phage-associated protein